jgi:putative ABC transport system permease protein
MWRLRRALLRLFNTVRSGAAEPELAREIASHLALLEEEFTRRGMTPDQARVAARRVFGGVDQAKERHRDERAFLWLDDLRRDTYYAIRSLARNPGFACGAILTLALGVGANTTVFSVVNAVLLEPLPYSDPDRIVRLSNASQAVTSTASLSRQVSLPDFEDWRTLSTSFEAMAYYGSRETSVMPGATAEYARAARVGPDFCRVFAVEPVLGRLFTPDEMKPGSAGALLISYAYWQSRFGGDTGVLTRSVRLQGRALQIVGVLPPGFHFPDDTALWFPADTITRETREYRSANNYLAVARLKRGVRLEQAQAEMAAIAARLEQQYPDSNKGRTVVVARMRDDMVGDIRPTLFLLWAAVGVVLLIACANTATLLLAKATSRAREIAVRAALGASRRRILRQVITESLILACLGALAGVILAVFASNVLVAWAPASVPRIAETSVDGRVLLFTLGVAVLTSVLSGLVPALYASRVDLNHVLKQSAARSVVGGTLRLRGTLVVAQIAFSVVLLAGAGLLIKSFVALQTVALGFRPENVLVVRATVPGAALKDSNQYFKDMLDRVSHLPGVIAAGATMAPPGRVESDGGYFVDTLPSRLTLQAPSAVRSVVTPGTFAALGIPVVRGRDFDERDSFDAPFTAVVNEALVRTSFPGVDPIGRTIFCAFDSLQGMTIVGVVGDVRQHGPAREPMPECFMPYQQHRYNGASLSLVVRTAGDPTALTETVRRLARERSAEVPVQITTMEAALSANVAEPRFRTWLFGVFAALSVCLVVAGVYSVLSYAVGQRSSEIGLRKALGASTSSVIREVITHGLVLTAVGLALGLAGAMAGTRLLTTMLFQVTPHDPMVYAGVIVLLGAVTMVASVVPAWRAANTDPLVALRQE